MRMRIKDYVTQKLNEEDSERFALWAFGDKYQELKTPDEFITAWNILHCELKELSGWGIPSIDIPEMVDLWLIEEEKEKKGTWGKSTTRWGD